MSWPRRRSRSGLSAIRRSSSPTSSAWAAVRELRLDLLLERGQAELLEARDLGLRKGLVRELGEWRTAPERQRFAVVSLADEALEATDVDLLRLDAEEVARCLGDERSRRQDLAQPRDVDLNARHGGLGRALAPELVDKPIPGDDLVGVQKEDGEQRALLRAAERERVAVGVYLERPKKTEVHRV